MFPKLADSQNFTKLDLSQAYMQLVLDRDLEEYPTVNTSLDLFHY